MPLSIYLYFPGTCGEAFDHYKTVFDAEEICRQFFADGPEDIFGNQPADQIMHTTIRIGDAILMGSDFASNEPLVAGNNVIVAFTPESPEEADRLFPRLAKRGTIMMPLQETFWGSYYGLCTDRFGIHWMFNCPSQP